MGRFRIRRLSDTAIDKLAAALNSGRIKRIEGMVACDNIAKTYAMSQDQRNSCVFVNIIVSSSSYIRPISRNDWDKIQVKAAALNKALKNIGGSRHHGKRRKS